MNAKPKVRHRRDPALRLLPPGIAYAFDDGNGFRMVTIEEARDRRRERQRVILERKREPSESWRAVKLWVAYFDMTLMGGWQAFIEDRHGCLWIDRDGKFFKEPLMQLFHLSFFRDWCEWKPAFANRYQRRSHDGMPLGVVCLWRRRDELALSPRRELP